MSGRYRLQTCDANSTQDDIQYPFSVNDTIVITNDKKGVADYLAQKFRAHRYRCDVVSEIPAHSDVVILLEGLQNFPSDEAAIDCNTQAFLHTKAIAKRFSEKGGVLISVQDTGGQFGLSAFSERQAWSAGLAGLVKTAAIEWPKAFCKAIDIQQGNLTAEAVAERIFQEIMQGRAEQECGLLADGKRIVMEVLPEVATTGECIINHESVIIVLGGGRGITASCMLALAKQTKATFVLLGRTQLETLTEAYLNKSANELKTWLFTEAQTNGQTFTPKQINSRIAQIQAVQEIQATVQALQAAGSSAEYVSLDILNSEMMATTLQQVRKKYGKITGLIHGAGVLADKLLTDLTREQFLQVFNTKVLGLKNCLHATKQDNLNFIGLFSSVAARFGNAGQAAYAMANEVLNKVAQAEQGRRGKQCRVKSFNWGPWDKGMVTPELKALFSQRGIVLLPEQQGVQLFLDELAHTPGCDVEVVCGATLAPVKQLNQNYSHTYRIHPTTHPYLNSHVINQHGVIPACLVLDWFVRAWKNKVSRENVIACQNFSVLQGIRFPIGVQQAEELQVFVHENGRATLTNALGRDCYSADLAVVAKPLDTTLAVPTLAGLQPWPKQDHVLFHGPDFQVVHHLEGISESGGKARLGGLYELNWPAEEWSLDVAALDGVLQLLLLWRYHFRQEKSLPTHIGKITLFSASLPTSELTCVFHCHTQKQHRFIANAILLHGKSEPYALLEDIEMCVAQI